MFSQNDEVSQLINEVLASQSQKSYSQQSQPQPIVYSQNSKSSKSQETEYNQDLDEKSINTILAKSSIFSKVAKACEPAQRINTTMQGLTPIKQTTPTTTSTLPLKQHIEQLDIQLIKLKEIIKSYEIDKNNDNNILIEIKQKTQNNYEKLSEIEKQIKTISLLNSDFNNNNKKEENLTMFNFIKEEINKLHNKINTNNCANNEKYDKLIKNINRLNKHIKSKDKNVFKDITNIADNVDTVTRYTNSTAKKNGSIKSTKNGGICKTNKKKFFSSKVDIDLTIYSDELNDINIKNEKEIKIKEINKNKINSFENKVLKRYKEKVKEKRDLDVYSFIGSL